MKNRIRTLLLSFIILVINLLSYGGKVEKTYYFNQPTINQRGDYQTIEFNSTLLTALPGQPVLPYQAIKILLPPGEKAESMEIIFAPEIIIDGQFTLYPQQHVRPISQGISGTFIKDESLYSKNTIYPSTSKGELLTSYLNGYAIAMSTFTPVKYNPYIKKVRYSPSVKVIIHTIPDENAKSVKANLRPINLINTFVDNPSEVKNYDSYTKEVGTDDYKLLIICTSEFAKEFDNYRMDYLKQGIRSKVTTLTDISSMNGADIQEKMRNYIIQEYQTHGIEYVLLAGDDELIPHRGFYCSVQSSSPYTDENIPADLYYSALDGNWNANDNNLWGEPGEDDLLPDVSVARMPFSNLSELKAMLNKTHKYRYEPVEGEFKKVLLAGENLYDEPLTWGSDYLNLLIGFHSDNGYTTIGIPLNHAIDSMYDEHGSWSGDDLMAKLNQGYPLLNHVGHANETYVMKLYNSDINNQNFSAINGTTHNFTLVYTHGCLCGAFDNNDCIAEKMVTINNFASAFVGNSRYGWFNEGQTEGPSAHLNREFIDAIYNDNITRIGESHKISKIETSPWVTAPGQWEPGALRWCFYCCNVLGDPGLSIYTNNLIPFQTLYPTTLQTGTSSMPIKVSSGTSPLPNMKCVVINNNTIIGEALTDNDGNAVINFNPIINIPDTIQLTVSGAISKPITYDIYIVNQNSIENTITTSPIQLMPNPTNDKLNIKAVSLHSGNIVLSIYQADGKLYKTWVDAVTVNNVYQKTIDVNQFPKGTYLVKVAINNQEYSQKLIVN